MPHRIWCKFLIYNLVSIVLLFLKYCSKSANWSQLTSSQFNYTYNSVLLIFEAKIILCSS